MATQHVQDIIPGADKAIVAGGALSSWFLTMDYVDTVLALIIAGSTIVLIWVRIALAIREWRRGKQQDEALRDP